MYLVEGGVSLKLTLVDTPGFGDAINNTKWYVFMLEYFSKSMVSTSFLMVFITFD